MVKTIAELPWNYLVILSFVLHVRKKKSWLFPENQSHFCFICEQDLREKPKMHHNFWTEIENLTSVTSEHDPILPGLLKKSRCFPDSWSFKLDKLAPLTRKLFLKKIQFNLNHKKEIEPLFVSLVRPNFMADRSWGLNLNYL